MPDVHTGMDKREIRRISLLHSINILDTPIEEPFERLCRLLRRVLDMPYAGISMVDTDRCWFKCFQGVSFSEIPRHEFFCATTITDGALLVVPRASKDDRFKNLPLVTGSPKIEFYAGYPLSIAKNLPLGAIFVADTRPRELDGDDRMFLQDLAETAASEIRGRFVNSVYNFPSE